MLSILTGLIAGTFHVWSGPDHLSALAPLATQNQRRPWTTGIRWGLGHSSGVAVVGGLFLWFRGIIPIDLISHWGERMVGVMLLGIGLWGLNRALKMNIHAHPHVHDDAPHAHIHFHEKIKEHNAPTAHRHAHVAFGIGILHGLAGSSHFLGVWPALAFPTLFQAVAYILAFGLGTIFSMA